MKLMEVIKITGDDLTFDQIIEVAYNGAKVELDSGSLAKVRRSAAFIKQKVDEGEIIYGVTTGFGAKADKPIAPEHASKLQMNLLRSHATGVGENFPTHMVRAIMVIRLNTLMKGNSGIQVKTLDLLKSFLNNRVHPIVPQQGSLGASGDLCPLSHLALPLIGEGYVEYKGIKREARRFFKLKEIRENEDLQPLTELSYKEGLALNNGTSVMAALGTFVIWEFERLLKLATLTSSLMLEAFCARSKAFDEKVHMARNHPEQIEIARWVRKFTEGSTFMDFSTESFATLPNLPKVKSGFSLEDLAKKKVKPQDSYSFRCVPPVFGASLQVLNHARGIFAGELNAAVDNPLIFLEEGDEIPGEKIKGEIISGGNFHGQPLAFALDYLKLAIAEIGNIVERQINKLLDPATNDLLEPFLVYDKHGINSGLMISQYVAASLVSENKVLVHPASADSIPTSANTEDHVSMGATAGRQAYEILGNVRKIITIAILTAHHAMEIRQRQFRKCGFEARIAEPTEALFTEVKRTVRAFTRANFLDNDRLLFDDINLLAANYDNFVTIAVNALEK